MKRMNEPELLQKQELIQDEDTGLLTFSHQDGDGIECSVEGFPIEMLGQQALNLVDRGGQTRQFLVRAPEQDVEGLWVGAI